MEIYQKATFWEIRIKTNLVVYNLSLIELKIPLNSISKGGSKFSIQGPIHLIRVGLELWEMVESDFNTVSKIRNPKKMFIFLELANKARKIRGFHRIVSFEPYLMGLLNLKINIQFYELFHPHTPRQDKLLGCE